MTNEKQFFIKVLGDHLHNKKTAPPEGLDWSLVSSYAKHHQVEGIVWHQCKEYLESREELALVTEKLKKTAMKYMYYFINNSCAFQEIKKAFSDAGIHFFSVKGFDVANYYPIPAYRTMGDIDIVMPEEERNRADGIMNKLGFILDSDGYEKIYIRDRIKVEIHSHLIYKENYETLKRRMFFDTCWKYCIVDYDNTSSLDWSFHFLFLIEHTMRHFSGGGLGFRQFMDIAVIAKNCKELNWKWIKEKLKKIGLWDFALNTFAFCKRWWGVDFPTETVGLEENFFVDSTEMILKNGVFGIGNEKRKINIISKQLSRYNRIKPLRVIALGMKKFFISYNQLSNYSYCKFVKGRKYLLPVAWIYRFFYIVLNKKARIQEERDFIFYNSDLINDHENIMKKWGL